MKVIRTKFGAAYDEVNGQIYVLGGYDESYQGGQYLNQCEKYSIRQGRWKMIKPMEQKRAEFSACVIGTKYIYAIAGTNGSYLKYIEKYDMTKNFWVSIEVDRKQENSRLLLR